MEADSPEEADTIAQENGVYFDGVSSGKDCSCCGDRWHRAWESGDEKPEIYGEEYEIVLKKSESSF